LELGLMSRKLLLDIAERTLWTGIQAAAASLLVLGIGWDSLKVAGAAGAAAILKCVVASHVGDDNSAAALPGSVDAGN
jgi:hypothetical protein